MVTKNLLHALSSRWLQVINWSSLHKFFSSEYCNGHVAWLQCISCINLTHYIHFANCVIDLIHVSVPPSASFVAKYTGFFWGFDLHVFFFLVKELFINYVFASFYLG